MFDSPLWGERWEAGDRGQAAQFICFWIGRWDRMGRGRRPSRQGDGETGTDRGSAVAPSNSLGSFRISEPQSRTAEVSCLGTWVKDGAFC